MAHKFNRNSEKYTRIEVFEKIPVSKAILQMSIPTIISQMINVIYNVADTFYVGRTGNPYMIAGVSLAFTLFIFTITIINPFGMGGGSLMARLMGAGREDSAKNVCSFSFYASGITALIYSLLIGIFITPLLKLLGASSDTFEYAFQYTLIVVVIGSLPITLQGVMAHLLRNAGYSKEASIGQSGGGILNIILDPLFMFVIFDPGMEVFAAALATLISNIAAALYLMFVIARVSKKGAPMSFSLKKAVMINKEEVKEVFSVGIPSAVLSGLFDIANVFLNSQMSVHGDLQLAAIGICMKAERIPHAIGLGISQGMLPIVAYNYSSGNHKRMKSTISMGRRMGLIASCTCVVMYFLFAPYVAGFFLDTESQDALIRTNALTTLGFAVAFLKFRTLASPVQFMNYHSSFCMQAMGDGKGTLIHAVVRIVCLYIPLMFLFNTLFGANGLAVALAASESVSALIALYFLRSFIHKNTKIEL